MCAAGGPTAHRERPGSFLRLRRYAFCIDAVHQPGPRTALGLRRNVCTAWVTSGSSYNAATRTSERAPATSRNAPILRGGSDLARSAAASAYGLAADTAATTPRTTSLHASATVPSVSSEAFQSPGTIREWLAPAITRPRTPGTDAMRHSPAPRDCAWPDGSRTWAAGRHVSPPGRAQACTDEDQVRLQGLSD